MEFGRIPQYIPVVNFCEVLRRFADVRKIFGIPKRGTSLYDGDSFLIIGR